MTSHKFLFAVTLTVVLFAISLESCYCTFKNGTVHAKATRWRAAGITWYGDPNGAGSTGGACGYGEAVANPPFNALVSAAGPSLFKDGKGCGTCYKILCTHHPACSRKPIKVVITDQCPGGPCAAEDHFDLSGKAVGALAKPGKAAQLRDAGVLRVLYRRTPCFYRKNIAISIDKGANPYYMAFIVQYCNGNGNFACVELQPAGGKYIRMERMRSAVWRLNPGVALKGPFNVRLTSGKSGKSRKVVVAKAVIPANWSAGKTYHSSVNF